MKTEISKFLKKLNADYAKLHTVYESFFWISYMGDHTVNSKKDAALKARDAFRADPALLLRTKEFHKKTKGKEKESLAAWLTFFTRYQCPPELLDLKDKIAKLESSIEQIRSTRKEGYIDPSSKKFVPASEIKMRTMIRIEKDETLRKACFNALNILAMGCLDEYIQLIALRNEYARKMGYEDFYAFKLQLEEGMKKNDLFSIFDDVYEKTKYAFKDIRTLEKKMNGLRKPWNFAYMMAGDFTKEEDPYFQFEDALLRWGKSFAALSIDFKGGTLQLDLMDRKGKYNNGFCHWPELVRYEKGKRIPGSSNFTCNVVMGQVGAGSMGLETLFHEGGHAAHLLNSIQSEVCLNHEYPPMSTAWAETQSMFLDTLFSGIEWKTRYAKNIDGKAYPFDLYERNVRKLHPLQPLSLMGIMFVCGFEKEIYESKLLTKDKIVKIAIKTHKKYFDQSEDSPLALTIPHLYSWESACSYHGYGLAELALFQWRNYFFKKHGIIVDNPEVGKEMSKVWALAAGRTFKEFVILATGRKLSADSFIKAHTEKLDQKILNAKKKIADLSKRKEYTEPVQLNASIRMVHGKKVIADNSKSFEEMAEKYKKWLTSNKAKK